MNAGKNRNEWVVLMVSCLGFGIIGGPVWAKDNQPTVPSSQPSAKDIFYRLEQTAESTPPILALNYKILLKRGNQVNQVTSDYAFQSGDCFRLAFTGNVNGYIYLLHKGSTGNGRFLFPDARIDQGRHRVAAYQEHIVPAEGWFVFDGNAGKETIHVIQTQQPMPELLRLMNQEEILPSRWERVVDSLVSAYQRLTNAGRIKDIIYVDAGQSVTPPSHVQVNVESGEGTGPGANAEPEQNEAALPAAPGVEAIAEDRDESQEEEQVAALSNESQSPPVRPLSEPSEPVDTLPIQGNQTTQTYVAQAQAPLGVQSLLVHTIILHHE